MRKEHTEGDTVERVIGIVYLPELGYVIEDPVLKEELARLTELHDPDCGQDLRYRGVVEDSTLIDRTTCTAIGEAVMVPCPDLTIDYEKCRCTDDSIERSEERRVGKECRSGRAAEQ